MWQSQGSTDEGCSCPKIATASSKPRNDIRCTMAAGNLQITAVIAKERSDVAIFMQDQEGSQPPVAGIPTGLDGQISICLLYSEKKEVPL